LLNIDIHKNRKNWILFVLNIFLMFQDNLKNKKNIYFINIVILCDKLACDKFYYLET